MMKKSKFCRFSIKKQHIYAKNHSFKKYDPLNKFLFRQLVVNFADFGRNNSVLTGGGGGYLKTISSELNSYFENYS